MVSLMCQLSEVLKIPSVFNQTLTWVSPGRYFVDITNIYNQLTVANGNYQGGSGSICLKSSRAELSLP